MVSEISPLGQTFGDYLSGSSSELILRIEQHALFSVVTIVIAAIIGVLLAIATYRNVTVGNLTISTAAVGFTLPSVALFGILYSVVGASLLLAVLPVLVLYALLPIVRNSIVGLQTVDPNILDAARGMGMGRFRMLWQIELPIAWPVILAGLRVSAQLTVGIFAIAGFVVDIGLGPLAYASMANLGSAGSGNKALACVIFVIAIALVLDAIFVVIRRFTTPRGARV